MAEKDETDRFVAAFETGAFVSVRRPGWWEGELDRIYMSERALEPHFSFETGADLGVVVFSLERKRGFCVQFWSEVSSEEVWCRDSASLMDLLTTRAQGWLALSARRTLLDQVEDIKEALRPRPGNGGGDGAHGPGRAAMNGSRSARRRRAASAGAGDRGGG